MILSKLLTLGLLWLVLACQAWAAGVQVQADRDTVQVGDDFTLTFSTDQALTVAPDLTPLSKDFQVTGTSTSTNMQYINGQMTQQTGWIVSLFANRTGTLQIPSISFGTLSSEPMTIQVVDQGAEPNGNANTDILVELSAEPSNPYVQQQVIVTQRLLHVVPLLPTRASMSHPELEKGKGLIQQLGNTKSGTVNRNGIRYQMIERRYAVFPQVSGEISIGRTVFQGALDDRRSRQLDPFGIGGKQVRRFSEPLVIKVQPHPQVKSTWLPANSLTLNAHWESVNKTLKAGEPVTLTIAIIADGLMAEQLPALDIKPPMGIKGYANQPEFRNDLGGNSVIGMREEKWVLMGTADGSYVLPEIKIDWWDLKAKKMQTARIDPTPLKVVGMGQTKQPTDPADPVASASPPAAPDAASNLLNPSEETPPSTQAVDKPELAAKINWQVLVIGLIVLAALAGLAFMLLKRKQKPTQVMLASNKVVPPLQTIKLACQQNDAQAAFQGLHEWIREDLKLSPPTVAALRAQADLPLKQALDDLSTVLYASTTHVWEGQELWQAIQNYQQAESTPAISHTQALAELYPS
ncbi:MAG: BatD family protein [Thiolinea sp.]